MPFSLAGKKLNLIKFFTFSDFLKIFGNLIRIEHLIQFKLIVNFPYFPKTAKLTYFSTNKIPPYLDFFSFEHIHFAQAFLQS
jgi:hypothetical protein